MFLIAITFTASVLHLLFEALAFHSDIEFWKSTKSLTGISVKSVIFDLISQIIVFLFLLDQESSFLILIPMVFGIAIQIWKVILLYYFNLFTFFCYNLTLFYLI